MNGHRKGRKDLERDPSIFRPALGEALDIIRKANPQFQAKTNIGYAQFPTMQTTPECDVSSATHSPTQHSENNNPSYTTTAIFS